MLQPNLKKGPTNDLRWWRLFFQSFFALARLALAGAALIAVCWLFLAYGQAALIEKVLWAAGGVLAGGAGVIGYQRIKGHQRS